MNYDNPTFLKINEIDGEIGALKTTLNSVKLSETRRKEIQEEIRLLKEQKKELLSKVKKNDSENFRKKYQSNQPRVSSKPKDDFEQQYDGFYGPMGPNEEGR